MSLNIQQECVAVSRVVESGVVSTTFDITTVS